MYKTPTSAFFFLILSFSSAWSQSKTDFWNTLAEVSYTKAKDANGFEIERPVFSPTLRLYHSKTIVLSGYMVPLNEWDGKKTFMLSSLPFNVCYFCGGAGPETVVEVEPKKLISFRSKKISLQGTLVLNESDVDHHMYILKSATIVE